MTTFAVGWVYNWFVQRARPIVAVIRINMSPLCGRASRGVSRLLIVQLVAVALVGVASGCQPNCRVPSHAFNSSTWSSDADEAEEITGAAKCRAMCVDYYLVCPCSNNQACMNF